MTDLIERLKFNISVLINGGRFSEAVPLQKQYCEEIKSTYGTESDEYFNEIQNLAKLYHELRKYSLAAPLIKEVLDISRKKYGEEHPRYAFYLKLLAELYKDMGKYSMAVPLYKEYLEFTRNYYGDGDPEYTLALNKLGILYNQLGDISSAIELYKETVNITRKTQGEETPNYATDLSNLANLYCDIGDYASAEPLYKQALEIKRKVCGEEDPSYAISLSNLGTLYREMGFNYMAKPLYEEALAIFGKVYGEKHSDYSFVLNKLANIHNDKDEAESLSKQAREIIREVQGEEHPNYAMELIREAGILDDYDRAEGLLNRALEILQRTIGETHPHYGLAIMKLARIKTHQCKIKEADELYLKNINIENKMIDNVFSMSSERQKFEYIKIIENNMKIYLSFVDICHGFYRSYESPYNLDSRLLMDIDTDNINWDELYENKPEQNTNAFNVVLKRKGIILEALCAELEAAELSDEPDIIGKLKEFKKVSQEIAEIAYKSINNEEYENDIGQLENLKGRKEQLQAYLSRSSIIFSKQIKNKSVEITDISSNLPMESALVEFVAYYRNGMPFYMAFLLKDGADIPEIIFFNEDFQCYKIDKLIEEFRNEISAEKARYESGQAKTTTRDISIQASDKATGKAEGRDFREICKDLYDAVFAPFEEHLLGVNHIYFSPDGALNLLSLGALIDSDDKFLADKYEITYLASGRDLLRSYKGTPGDSAVFAAPDFSAGSIGEKAEENYKARQVATRAIDEGIVEWPELPATRMEAKMVKNLLSSSEEGQIIIYQGRDASEENLKSVKSPKLLHLATHGYFFRDTEKEKDIKTKPVMMGSGMDVVSGIGKFENPMLQSGLVLSGANRLLRGEEIHGEDGWVTAEDVSGLNLRGTELVVLSACDTGVGHVKCGEGVMGLRRAFRMAGAKSLVMSLWKVPDQETQELMIEFYNNYRESGKITASLRASQLELKNRAGDEGGLLHPFYWAAFICEGGVESAKKEDKSPLAVLPGKTDSPDQPEHAIKTGKTAAVPDSKVGRAVASTGKYQLDNFPEAKKAGLRSQRLFERALVSLNSGAKGEAVKSLKIVLNDPNASPLHNSVRTLIQELGGKVDEPARAKTPVAGTRPGKPGQSIVPTAGAIPRSAPETTRAPTGVVTPATSKPESDYKTTDRQRKISIPPWVFGLIAIFFLFMIFGKVDCLRDKLDPSNWSLALAPVTPTDSESGEPDRNSDNPLFPFFPADDNDHQNLQPVPEVEPKPEPAPVPEPRPEPEPTPDPDREPGFPIMPPRNGSDTGQQEDEIEEPEPIGAITDDLAAAFVKAWEDAMEYKDMTALRSMYTPSGFTGIVIFNNNSITSSLDGWLDEIALAISENSRVEAEVTDLRVIDRNSEYPSIQFELDIRVGNHRSTGLRTMEIERRFDNLVIINEDYEVTIDLRM